MFAAATDRLPPQSVDAEEAILGGILLDPNAIERVKDILQPEAFYFNSHRNIYRAALALHEDGKPTDLLGVSDYLKSKHWLEGCGGMEKIVQLVDRTVSAVNIDYLAGLVNEKYRRRQIIELSLEIHNLGYDTFTNEAVILEEAKLKLEKIASLSTGVVTTKEKLIAEIKKIDQLESPVDQYFAWDKLAKDAGKSVKTLKELAMAIEADEPLTVYSAKEFAQRQIVETEWLFPGLLRMGTTSLLVAESKTGKSLLHYDWAYHIATGTSWGEFPAADPQNVLIVQTDEPEIDCQTRIKYRGLDELDNVNILTNFSTHRIGRLRKEIQKRNIKVVIIDSLLSINRFSSVNANEIEFAYFMYRLKDLASEFGCHFLLISHTNKSASTGLDKIAGSYGIPASVSDIFLLSRKPNSPPDDLERILSRLGSRSDARSAWKIALNLENYSFEYLGHCDKDGNTDDEAEKETESKKDCRELILGLLKANAPTAYEAVEIAHHINFNLNTVRGALGALASGVAPLIASKWLERQGKSRPKAYFYPAPLADRHDHGDQASDQPRNPDTASVSLVDRMPDREKPQKNSSGNSATVEAEPSIDCYNSAPKSENFLSDRAFDQANQNPSNPTPVSVSMPDRMPD